MKVAALILLAAFASQAAVVYTNIGPTGSNYVQTGNWQANDQFVGTPFTPTGSGQLHSITLPYSTLFGAPVPMWLYTDTAGLPGTILESWNATTSTLYNTTTTVTSVVNPMLTSGTQYWFVVLPPGGPDYDGTWFPNGTGETGGGWYGYTPTALVQEQPSWDRPGLLVRTIDTPAAPIPEPATTALAAAGLLFAVTLGRRYRVRSPR